MTIEEHLRVIQERADAATDGPWVTFDTSSEDPDLNDGLPHILMPEYMRAMASWNEIGYVSVDYPDDAEFIAHSRTDVPRLVAALLAVLDLLDKADERDPQAGDPPVMTGDFWRGISEALGSAS